MKNDKLNYEEVLKLLKSKKQEIFLQAAKDTKRDELGRIIVKKGE